MPNPVAHERHANAVAGLDSMSAALVTRILDSADMRGLPMPSLIARVREGIRRIASVIQTLATAEGLAAHAESVRVRCANA